jgi:hypothetical protein
MFPLGSSKICKSLFLTGGLLVKAYLRFIDPFNLQRDDEPNSLDVCTGSVYRSSPFDKLFHLI